MATIYQLRNQGILISTHHSLRPAEEALKRIKGVGSLIKFIDGKVTEIGTFSGGIDIEWRNAKDEDQIILLTMSNISTLPIIRVSGVIDFSGSKVTALPEYLGKWSKV